MCHWVLPPRATLPTTMRCDLAKHPGATPKCHRAGDGHEYSYYLLVRALNLNLLYDRFLSPTPLRYTPAYWQNARKKSVQGLGADGKVIQDNPASGLQLEVRR